MRISASGFWSRIEVAIDQIYFHCPKAFLRSELWVTTSWPEPDALPSTAQLAKRLARPDEPLEKIEEYYGAGYAARLY